MTTASLLVVTDVDSTLIRDEVIELLARAVGPDAERHVAAVTERAMRGEIDFAASLAERLLVLEGLPASIVDEARALAERGVKELNLVGQDSNSWGRDIGAERLPDLLRALDGVDGIEWVRLLYSYPAKFKDDLIDAFVELDSVVPYIDMPLQHISNPILKAMRRGVSSDRTRKLLSKLRTRIPDVAIRTGFIVGFPGETEEHFEELMEFVEEQRFDNAGVFTFSPQEETPAAHLPDQVPEEVRRERRDRLMTLQQELHLENNTDWLGRTVDVLVEGMHPETELLWVGRSARQAPEIDGRVIINDAANAAFGDIVKVEISDVAGYDLVGAVVD